MGYPYPPQQPGYPMQPYPAAPKPNGATAITAGVLAVLGGLWAIVGTISYVAVAIEYSSLPSDVLLPLILGGVYSLILVGLLLTGGILLFLKKPAGRWMTISGCALVIVVQLVMFLLYSLGAFYFGFVDPVAMGLGGFVSVLVAVVPAIVTLVLAILPSTARWTKKSVPPPQQQQQQPGGYPYQQRGW